MKKVVFTNGCFDIIHPGHIQLLEQAKALGTHLVVGINSDRSTRTIKGPGRPVMNEAERKAVLLALRPVDEVRVFDDLTPAELIEQVKPDVLVKGGDWPVSEIVGASFVQSYGGEVHSLPIKDGFSSTNIIEKMMGEKQAVSADIDSVAAASLAEHQDVFAKLVADHQEQIERCARLIFDTFTSGHKAMIFGNGGSAADAQDLASELVGRFESERPGFAAIALTTDTSILTAVSNDYAFEKVFVRQIDALATAGDCVIAISTSGTSPNVIAGVMRARELGCRVVSLTGEKGKKLAGLSDECVMVPSSRTARIQEGHAAIAHIWCEMIDKWLTESN